MPQSEEPSHALIGGAAGDVVSNPFMGGCHASKADAYILLNPGLHIHTAQQASITLTRIHCAVAAAPHTGMDDRCQQFHADAQKPLGPHTQKEIERLKKVRLRVYSRGLVTGAENCRCGTCHGNVLLPAVSL